MWYSMVVDRNDLAPNIKSSLSNVCSSKVECCLRGRCAGRGLELFWTIQMVLSVTAAILANFLQLRAYYYCNWNWIRRFGIQRVCILWCRKYLAALIMMIIMRPLLIFLGTCMKSLSAQSSSFGVFVLENSKWKNLEKFETWENLSSFRQDIWISLFILVMSVKVRKICS